jgi:hypothetical protein
MEHAVAQPWLSGEAELPAAGLTCAEDRLEPDIRPVWHRLLGLMILAGREAL